jgi:hypothetical protein
MARHRSGFFERARLTQSSRKSNKHVDDDQRLLIEILIELNKESAVRYQALQDNRSVMAFSTMLMANTALPPYPVMPSKDIRPAREIRSNIQATDIFNSTRSMDALKSQSIVCICGQHPDQSSSHARDHITVKSLKQWERQLSSIIRQIDLSQQRLEGNNFSSPPSKRDTPHAEINLIIKIF